MRTPRLLLLPLALGAAVTLGACERATGPVAATSDAVAVGEASGTAIPIDTSASAIGFRGTKVTGGHDGGFHVFDGQITATDSAVTGVRLNIAMPSIWTDDQKLTGHLQSADFFDVALYPAATFESSEIVRRDTAGATHLVTGNLTMHGATQSITFPATITRAPGMASAKASFVIDRTRWGVLYTGAADNLISNDVTISFDVTGRDGTAAPMADSSMAAGSAAPAAGATGEAPPAAPQIESMTGRAEALTSVGHRPLVRAYVGIGSNLGDRLAQMRRAVAALRMAPGVAAVAASPLYESAAHRLPGADAAPDYLNAVLAIDTTLAPPDLLDLLLATETDGGRTRPVPWAPRTLDLDLLLAGDAALDTPRLTLPHPRLRRRRFVLAPLADLAPDLPLPPDGATVGDALAVCPDEGRCVRVADGGW